MNQEDDFLNKRVRLQRLSDLKFFSGWCTQLKGQACAIVINPSKSPYAVGDEFSAEIYGAEKRAVVTVQLTRIGSEGCEFMLKSPLRLLQTDAVAACRNLTAVTHFRVSFDVA